MAKLQHPHILRCYGGNLEGPNPLIVTELCECSLDKVCLGGGIGQGSMGSARGSVTVTTGACQLQHGCGAAPACLAASGTYKGWGVGQVQ